MLTPHPSQIRAARLFDGRSDAPLRDHVVELENGRIRALRPATAADAPADCAVLAPGFIDLQVNGAADRLFNDTPTVECLDALAAGMRRGGTAHLLPTFITAPAAGYIDAIRAAASAIARKVPGILGVHLEGPFLSPERPGIHDRSAIRPLTRDDVARLSAPFPGVMMLTVAPECQSRELLRDLHVAGIRLFAGHTEASYAEITACDALTGATHLWNAMSQITGREPGLTGAVLDSDHLFAGIIADGFHVAPANLRLAGRLLPDRLCLVSDAMPSFAGRETSFMLHGVMIHLRDGRLTDAHGTLAGAHVGQDECVGTMIRHRAATPTQALRMASGNPARALGLGDELGAIAPGYRASLTLLNDEFRAQGVVVDGARLL